MIHISYLHGTPLLTQIGKHAVASYNHPQPAVAITSSSSSSSVGALATTAITYPQLCSAILMLAIQLISIQSRTRCMIGGSDLSETKVVILIEEGSGLGALAVLGTLAAGGVAVPVTSAQINEGCIGVLTPSGDGEGGREGKEARGLILHDKAHRAKAEQLAKQEEGWVIKCISEDDLRSGSNRRRTAEDVEKERDDQKRSSEWTRDLPHLDQNRQALIIPIESRSGNLLEQDNSSNSSTAVVAETLTHADLTELLSNKVAASHKGPAGWIGRARLLDMLHTFWMGETVKL